MIYAADWILPVAHAAVRHGWVETDGDRIVALGSGRRSGATDFGRAAILPSLVNAHTHLELSYLHGKIPPTPDLVTWIRRLLAERTMNGDSKDGATSPVTQAATEALASARRSGTGLVGEVTNSLSTVPAIRAGAMPAHVFYEVLGFNEVDPVTRVAEARARLDALEPGFPSIATPEMRLSLAPHAPYSVSPGLLAALRSDCYVHGARSSIHLAESHAETQFLADGTGPLRALLEDVGAWSAEWCSPNQSSVAYLADRGMLDSSVAVVHATQCTGADLERLRQLDVSVIACPRSNRFVGEGAPPLEAFFAVGVTVAFGTDSLASVGSLSLFDELVEARRIAPGVTAPQLLEAATVGGARALGFDRDYGSIAPGKRASLIAVSVPGDVSDVEEYLVSGIQPDQIRWVEP